MRKFDMLLDETKQVIDLEELEASADLFQYGLDNNYYNRLQQHDFNNLYWQLKNKFLAQSIENNFKNTNCLDIIYIVSKAPSTVKENQQQLIAHVSKILKSLKKSKVA